GAAVVRPGQDLTPPPAAADSQPTVQREPEETPDSAEPAAPGSGPVEFGTPEWFARMNQRVSGIKAAESLRAVENSPTPSAIESALGTSRALPARPEGGPIRRRSVVQEMSGEGVTLAPRSAAT